MSEPKSKEPRMIADMNESLIAELMGIEVSEVAKAAETNPALENLGDGIFRVWEVK